MSITVIGVFQLRQVEKSNEQQFCIRGNIPTMDSPLQKIVRARLDELETNPFEAAKSAGLERSFLNDILIGKKVSFRADKSEQVARALQLDPKDFAARIATPIAPRTVPIMGYLGAGAGGIFLRSWNDIEPIGPVKLEWIGEIFATLPPAAVKRIARQGGIQGQLRFGT